MAGRGKHARQKASLEASAESELTTGTADQDVLRRADTMLAMLAAEQTRPLPGLSRRLDSTASRVAFIAGGTTLIAVLLVVVMAVLGTLL